VYVFSVLAAVFAPSLEFALVQSGFVSSALHVVKPDMAASLLDASEAAQTSAVGQTHLSASNLGISVVESIVADGTPGSFVQHFQSAVEFGFLRV